MKHRLTLLIPCKNEEKNIRPCIESAKELADEILVADSGSTDRTMDIARELGARIIEREYVNSADFKNWAIPQATHEWILLLDSDERATPRLVSEVRRILDGEPKYDGYWIYRANYLMGYRMRSCGWNSDKVIRLFKKEYRYEPKHVHAEVVMPRRKTGRLKGRLEHYTYWTFDQYLEKLDRYTKWGALDAKKKGTRPGLFALMFRPAWRFFRHYFVQFGFLEGRRGFILAALGAYSAFLKYARLWEMEKAKPQPDPEEGRT